MKPLIVISTFRNMCETRHDAESVSVRHKLANGFSAVDRARSRPRPAAATSSLGTNHAGVAAAGKRLESVNMEYSHLPSSAWLLAFSRDPLIVWSSSLMPSTGSSAVTANLFT
jgi:hypothetical protein